MRGREKTTDRRLDLLARAAERTEDGRRTKNVWRESAFLSFVLCLSPHAFDLYIVPSSLL
jgi:hypothetical protein